ncbi:uncharacterized protein LOC129921593 [Biomphalaria glabrata]|uniref:Uncharacterized protein LOC129921593 n=1 Tax=Biomphalaria glabrata TaxID=6526 RepID=A0A9W3B1E3_BIOGL|nr:uncharacterized protein LOC129921593 [Biomphalaria glabrata]
MLTRNCRMSKMTRYKLTKLLIILSLVTGVFLFLTIWTNTQLIYQQITSLRDSSQQAQKQYYQAAPQMGFLLDTPHCKIPNIDPFDPSVMSRMSRRGEILCVGRRAITYTEGSILRLNRTRIEQELNGDFKSCHYQPILRPKPNDFNFAYGDHSNMFDHDILIPPKDEFIRVACFSQSDGKLSTQYHATVSPKDEVERRCSYKFNQHKKKFNPKETYNVHMIGVDSVSRLNFIRQMPQTRHFLHTELRAFEMAGYNKVADNTFVNIVPMMMGKFVHEIGWNETMNKHPFDEYAFFWKNFSNAGYRTLYAEDAPKIAIFVYAKEGFHTPPADYYNRALQLALEKDKSVWNKNHHCVTDKLETTMVLDYVTDFSRVFKNKPHFGFTFITRLTHDSLNLAGSADYAYVKFLKQFKKEGHFNNTVLIFYSDHGYRFGNMRTSYIGKVEERLPFMYLVFPPSFHEKYPELVKNLKQNTFRLTTPFDVYETLKDILYFDGLNKTANVTDRGISLLREIPKERTCENAKILPHWCLCLEQASVDLGGRLAGDIARSVVSLINDMLRPASHLCAELTLAEILDIVQMKSNENVLRFQDSFHDVINQTVVYGNRTEAPVVYQVTLKTAPGGAVFEVTVAYDTVFHAFKLGGDVSRINAYEDQSACIENFKLKKMCYCVKR